MTNHKVMVMLQVEDKELFLEVLRKFASQFYGQNMSVLAWSDKFLTKEEIEVITDQTKPEQPQSTVP